MPRLFFIACSIVLLSGCSPSSPKGFDSPDPQERARAGLDAAASGDRSRVPELVELLQNDDPAARLAAIGGLRQLTGKDFAYDYAGSERSRWAAIERWKEWMKSDEGRAFVGDKGNGRELGR